MGGRWLRPFDAGEMAVVRRMVAEGATKSEVARALGIAVSRLSCWAKRHPELVFLDGRLPVWQRKAALSAALLADVRAGFGVTDIARRQGVSGHIVRRFKSECPELSPEKANTTKAARQGVAALRRHGPAPVLSAAQLADYHLLRGKGQYSREEALEAVTRPRVTLRAVPSSQRSK